MSSESSKDGRGGRQGKHSGGLAVVMRKVLDILTPSIGIEQWDPHSTPTSDKKLLDAEEATRDNVNDLIQVRARARVLKRRHQD